MYMHLKDLHLPHCTCEGGDMDKHTFALEYLDLPHGCSAALINCTQAFAGEFGINFHSPGNAWELVGQEKKKRMHLCQRGHAVNTRAPSALLV